MDREYPSSEKKPVIGTRVMLVGLMLRASPIFSGTSGLIGIQLLLRPGVSSAAVPPTLLNLPQYSDGGLCSSGVFVGSLCRFVRDCDGR